jgi:hypothetical protein
MNFRHRLHGPMIAAGLAFLLLQASPSQAAFRYHAPSFDVRVVDARTGKGIEHAIVEVSWNKLNYSFFHAGFSALEKRQYVTDGSGAFQVPAMTSTHVFSEFANIQFLVRHPLYETKGVSWARRTLDALQKDGPGARLAVPLNAEVSSAKPGSIVVSIPVLTLAEKYRTTVGVASEHGILYSEFLDDGPAYVEEARKLGIPVDIEAIFREWESIASRFPQKNLHDALESGERKIREIVRESRAQ